MNVLALDTSGRHISLALLVEKGLMMEYSEVVEDTASVRLPGLLQSTVLPLIGDLGRIDALGVCIGPGPFTGIRIGLTVCKALIATHKFSFLPVNSLKALSFPYLGVSSRVAGVMDAKRNEYYTAIYERSPEGEVEIMPPCLVKAEDLPDRILAQGTVPLVAGLLPEPMVERLENAGIRVVRREPFLARDVARITARDKDFWLRDSQLLEPLYLREPDAAISR